jgi:hypothetical protein
VSRPTSVEERGGVFKSLNGKPLMASTRSASSVSNFRIAKASGALSLCEQIQSKKLAVGRKLIDLPVMCSGSLLPIAAIQLWKSGAILGYHFLSGQNALGQKCWSEQRHNFFLLFVLVLSAVSQNQPLFWKQKYIAFSCRV